MSLEAASASWNPFSTLPGTERKSLNEIKVHYVCGGRHSDCPSSSHLYFFFVNTVHFWFEVEMCLGKVATNPQ